MNIRTIFLVLFLSMPCAVSAIKVTTSGAVKIVDFERPADFCGLKNVVKILHDCGKPKIYAIKLEHGRIALDFSGEKPVIEIFPLEDTSTLNTFLEEFQTVMAPTECNNIRLALALIFGNGSDS